MNIKISVGCTLAFTLVDLIVSTVLYCHGSRLSSFSEDLLDFNVLLSLVDLWGCVLIRACLLLGASAGVLWNRELGPRRVSQLYTLVLLVSLTLGTFALVKLLILSEREGGLTPWFLGLFSWTCVSALGVVLLWGLLGKETVPGGGGGSGGGDGGGDEDRERLVDDREKEEEEKEEGEEGLGRRTGAKAGPQKTGSGATLGRLLWYCSEDVGLLSTAFLFLLISAVCEAFLPYYTGKAIDGIVTQQSMEDFTQPLLKLSALALASALAIGVRGGVFSLTMARLSLRLRNKLFRSLMRQEIGFFDANHTGDITSRLTSDTTQVSDLVSVNVNIFLRSAVKAVGFFVFMFGLSWRLTLVTLMGFPFIAVVSKVYGDYYKRLTKEVQTSLAAANKVAEEVISSMRTVRSFACEEREADSYYSRLLVMYRLNCRQALAYACFMWSSCFSELALEVAILYYGGHLVVSGQMTGGTLIAFVIYALELVECLENISSVYSGLMQGVGAAEKVFEYLDREPQHRNDGQEAPPTCTGLVEFRDVTFAYPTRPETAILKGVSFTLRPGEVTALVGPSGSGKSSCVGLLENYYPPGGGQVLLDGRPVHTYRHDHLHSVVSLVGQEPVLFARTVEENISYGLTDVSMETVVEAASQANAHDFISALTRGYNTAVGEKGTQLSGGQKQRVAIARALIRQPRVLILDEATSALDAESEHIVQQALGAVMRGRTVLVVAHRLSTVERAHNILVLEAGAVAEQGSHAQLMARGGLYCRLVQRQLRGLEAGEAEVPTAPTGGGGGGGGGEEEEEERLAWTDGGCGGCGGGGGL
ncbi:ATP-binding cassette sub-family B member 9 isoform X2 [Gadus macrocephalus]|uniref:ATP-binding cassette sub-family B member 9 isoform X2 n=1 Tax=Gadus macrocephalus TaxID=80720 RepID=UPI0028CB6AD4|nr:ATP-binding cassette sub-family B member 9 isoform X2 [Gadus macrocephalus]